MTSHKVKLYEEFATAKAIGMQQGFVGWACQPVMGRGGSHWSDHISGGTTKFILQECKGLLPHQA